MSQMEKNKVQILAALSQEKHQLHTNFSVCLSSEAEWSILPGELKGYQQAAIWPLASGQKEVSLKLDSS